MKVNKNTSFADLVAIEAYLSSQLKDYEKAISGSSERKIKFFSDWLKIVALIENRMRCLEIEEEPSVVIEKISHSRSVKRYMRVHKDGLRSIEERISAIQYTGENEDDCLAFCPNMAIYESMPVQFGIEGVSGLVRSGDYIIRFENGNFSHCRPTLFKKEWEEVTN